MDNRITIIKPGILSTIQDMGRFGYGGQGVSTSGAFDKDSAKAANRMASNDDSAAVIECLAGGLEFSIGQGAIVAFAGAHGSAMVEFEGRTVATSMNSRIVVPAGAIIRIGLFDAGVRGYIAIRGGIAVEPILGSRSTDTLGNIGPAKLHAGQEIPIAEPETTVGSSIAIYPAHHWDEKVTKLDVIQGPRDDWFTAEAITSFFTQKWIVQQDCNRVGVRIGGDPLNRAITAELASEGMVPGAIQVPSSGQPIIFGPDHPATGGYPVIGVLSPSSISRAGQLKPGSVIKFRRRRQTN